MAGGISIHAVDVSRACKAQGLHVVVSRVAGGKRIVVASGQIAENAFLKHPIMHGEGLLEGAYEVAFHVADYYREAGVTLPDIPFLDVVTLRFVITDTSEHLHLPLKMTPWGYSLFRGNP